MKKLNLSKIQTSVHEALSREQLRNVLGGQNLISTGGDHCGNNYECTVDCSCGNFYVCCTVECSETSNSITCGSVTRDCNYFCAA